MRAPSLFLVALLATAFALWTWTQAGDPDLALQPEEVGVPVVILNNGFHTDIALPRAVLEARSGPLAEASRRLAPGDWILIGWGDAKFYVDQSPMEGRLPDGARAFFRPNNPSVVMLDPYTGHPGRLVHAEQQRTLYLSPGAAAGLIRRVEQSLDLSLGEVRITATRPGDDARFYASVETFSMLHLCNHWAAELLNAAGLSTHPARAILSSEIIRTVDRASGGEDTAPLDLPTSGA